MIFRSRNQLKATAKQARAEIRELELEAVDLRGAVLTGREKRDVEVEVTVAGGRVTTVRVDTGEVIEDREATDADAQTGMFG